MRCKRCGGVMQEIEGEWFIESYPFGDQMVRQRMEEEPTYLCDCGCTDGFDEDDVYEELDGSAEMTDILCFLAAKNWDEAIRAIGRAKAEEDIKRIRRGRNEH